MAKTPRKSTRDNQQGSDFGRFVRRLRKGRGLTQEQLAERSALAADTIRRLESNEFSPSLHTLTKLAIGLRLDLSSLFLAYELGEIGADRELLAMARTLSPTELAAAVRVLSLLAGLLGAAATSSRVADSSDGEGGEGA